ncbi:MAG: hypothetical protein ABSG07_14360 [Terriglobales bacterium]|jgi:putative transposase
MVLFQNRYRVESTRLEDWDYSSRGWYFVTLCTKDKKCSLGHAVDGEIVLSDAGVIAEIEMKTVSSHYSKVTIDRYVVMPNHVHAIVAIDGLHRYSPRLTAIGPTSVQIRPQRPAAPSLSAVIGSYKAGVSRTCRLRGLLYLQWQPRFHDHILRSNAAVNAVREYIDHNPQNWVEDPDNTEATHAETRQAASLL